MAERLVLCIGAQKAGTTWLAGYLRAHPKAHLPPVKEVHYFDARFAPKWCRMYEQQMLEALKRDVAALTLSTCGEPALQVKLSAQLLRFRMIHDPRDYIRFMRWGASGKEVLFEATPDYSMVGEEGFAAMRSMHDDVRLIFLLRNPADRFLSSMAFNAAHNPAFDVAATFEDRLQREDYRLLGDYGRTIKCAEKVFGGGRLHVEFYETLFNPEALARICGFMDIETLPADFSARSNSSRPFEFTPEQRARARDAHAYVYRDIAALFPDRLPASWRNDLQALN